MKAKLIKHEEGMSELTKAYIAGFIDGDGCILAQIVRNASHQFKFQIKVAIVLYQKTSRYWFLEGLQKEIGGTLRKRNDGVSELSVTGFEPVRKLLTQVYPHLRMKRRTAELIFELLEAEKKVVTRGDFIEVCKKVDKVAEFTDSKKRIVTTAVVMETLGIKAESTEAAVLGEPSSKKP